MITLPFIASFLSRALAAPLQRGALSAETAFVASTAADAIDMLETIEASLGHMPDPARALASAVSRAAWLAASAGSPLPGAVTLLARLHRACPGALEGHLPAIATMTAGAPERDAAAFLSLWTLEMRAAGARSAARVPARASCSAVVQAAALLPPSVSRDVALQALRELCAVFDVRQNYGASGTAEEGHVLAETVWHLGGGAAARGCDAAAMLASLATCLESGGVLARGEDPGPSGKRTALTLEIPEEASGPVLGRLAMSQAAISAFLCDTEPRVVNAACRAAAALVRLGSRSGSRGSAVSGAARGAALALLPVVLWRVQILGMQRCVRTCDLTRERRG